MKTIPSTTGHSIHFSRDFCPRNICNLADEQIGEVRQPGETISREIARFHGKANIPDILSILLMSRRSHSKQFQSSICPTSIRSNLPPGTTFPFIRSTSCHLDPHNRTTKTHGSHLEELDLDVLAGGLLLISWGGGMNR